jgi:hypothetical protein
MRVAKQSAGQQLLAAEAGDCADRFVDAQEAAIGIDFRNTDRGMFVSGRKSLFLFEGVQPGTLKRGVRPFAGLTSRKQFTAPTSSPFASRNGSMLTDTTNVVPSACSTMRSTSRTGFPVASTSATRERATGVPSISKKRMVSLNSSCV